MLSIHPFPAFSWFISRLQLCFVLSLVLAVEKNLPVFFCHYVCVVTFSKITLTIRLIGALVASAFPLHLGASDAALEEKKPTAPTSLVVSYPDTQIELFGLSSAIIEFYTNNLAATKEVFQLPVDTLNNPDQKNCWIWRGDHIFSHDYSNTGRKWSIWKAAQFA